MEDMQKVEGHVKSLHVVNGSFEVKRRAVLQKPHIFYSEAAEANCLHRAANSSETAAQRIQCQQAAMDSQLQRIDDSLGRSIKDQTTVSGDDILLGIGSQFDSGSDPAPLTTEHGHGGHH
ncbi:hypothetical protein INS49_014836 [Diaporthe citri]|uniref:uncharacterized protein n=1 Tax=Diaporthe citri TaxID=83186 RepID=UPI001C826F30|nr:uncharacterized protein INS49_014836 [Diaporthe citri]KAG6356961.1 hypothetical protein INS49_014836 [Diaporthe citri]